MSLTKSVHSVAVQNARARESVASSTLMMIDADSKRPSQTQEDAAPAQDDTKLCWLEVDGHPYHPDHQVELLHLRAEVDALLLQLQTLSQKATPSDSN